MANSRALLLMEIYKKLLAELDSDIQQKKKQITDMLSEFQWHPVGECDCGNVLYYNEDYDKFKWLYFNPECDCRVEDKNE